MQQTSSFPKYQACQSFNPQCGNRIYILTKQQVDSIPSDWKEDFLKDKKVTIWSGKNKDIYLMPQKAIKEQITSKCYVQFSEKATKATNYLGISSTLLSSAYSFKRKAKSPQQVTVFYTEKSLPQNEKIIKLAQAKIRSKQWAMGRGDIQGIPQYFEEQALKLKDKLGVQVKIIKGDDLIQQGFRLLHAVGRGSKNPPTFINLSYKGNPDSDRWVAFIGKGVCFDTGGLQLKSTAGIKDMYLDKHGACSVFSAFQTVVEEKLKINLTCSMGFVQNFVSANSYRPSDIITSRKGLTVEIGNTDAQGRLVLADCMNWTQEFYKTDVLIEESTLTGAIVMALGFRYAGIFSNDQTLINDLKKAGYQSNEEVWHLPVDEYHHELLNSKFADVSNSNFKSQAGSSQAAGFLQRFVEQGVKWCHMDIAGVGIVGSEGTGFGARILVQYARNYTSK